MKNVLRSLLTLMPALALAPSADAQVRKAQIERGTPRHEARPQSRAAMQTSQRAPQSDLDRGWKAVLDWQPEEAVRRFDSAARSGQSGYRLAWGYGLAYGQLAKFPESIRWFEKASEQYQNNGRMLSDFGFSYLSWGIFTARTGKKPQDQYDAARYWDAAEKRFKDALRLAPHDSITYSRLAMLSYYRGKYAEAWRYVKQSRSLGGEELDSQFLKDLSARMPEPGKAK